MNPQEQITAAIEVLRDLWPNHDGPAHIVLADFNVDHDDIEWCIAQIDAGETYSRHYPSGHPVFAATRAVLEFLLTVSEVDRVAWAEDPYTALYGA